MLPDGQGILGQILNKKLVLKVIILLAHLYDHIFLVDSVWFGVAALTTVRWLAQYLLCLCLGLLLVHIHGTCLLMDRSAGRDSRLRIGCLEEVAVVTHRLLEHRLSQLLLR